MDKYLFKSESILYTSPLIKYCTIVNKWESVCINNLLLQHKISKENEEESENNQNKKEEKEKEYFINLNNESDIIEKEESEDENSEVTTTVNSQDRTKVNNQKSSMNENQEKRIFRDKCDSLNLDSETLSEKSKSPLNESLSLEKKNILFDKKSLKFITYNIWFNEYNFEARTKEILKLCEKKDPDVICLQEVTGSFMNLLMNTGFIQNNFYISNVPFQLKNWYDIVILSKYCCNAYVLPFLSKMSRKLLYITLFNKENEMIKIGTTHLESMNNIYKRENQLKDAYRVLNQYESIRDEKNKILSYQEPKWSFLLGDFNMTERDNYHIEKNNYIDFAYNEIKKGENIENYYTMKSMNGYPAWRPDRFTYKTSSKTFKVNKFEIFGKNPITKETFFNPVGTPSDHYGLYIECSL